VEQGVACVAIDTPSVGDKTAHKTLLAAEILVVEALVNLDKLTKSMVLFFALPLNIKGSDGLPCRAVALEDLPAV